MSDDIITRDSQGNLAVNTVSSTEASVPYNYDDCFTLDTNGRRALRVVGADGGGGGLPDQTGQSGKFLTTDGTDASWSDKPLVNVATGSRSIAIGGSGTIASIYSTSLGTNADPAGNFSVAIGDSSVSDGGGAIAIGYGAKTSAAGAIQLNTSVAVKTNSDADTFKVANHNGNFEIMDANGNLPADRLASTTGLADGNYRLRLTMASGVPTLSWVAE